MKRMITMLMVLALLLLSGCGGGGTEEREVDTARSFTHYYKTVMAAETRDTIYFIGDYDYYIKYVDKATGITGVLCGKPECSHDGRDCNGFTSTSGADCLFIDSGRLYWLCRSKDDIMSRTLYSAALDGTDRREEVKLDGDMIPDGQSNEKCFALYDGYFYYSVIEHTVEDGETVEYNYICAFPLDQKEEPFLILREKNNSNLSLSMRQYGDSLYITTNDSHVVVNEDGKTAAVYDFVLRRWDIKERRLETLYEDRDSTFRWTSEIWVTDECVYFDRISYIWTPRVWIYRFDFGTGECERLFSTEVEWDGGVGIADNIATGFHITGKNEGVYDFQVVIKDFEGNVLVNDTYSIDLSNVFRHYNPWMTQFLGRDETNAYYAFHNSYSETEGVWGYYTTVIEVALEGSGARELCSTVENRATS